ncbi:protein TPX2 [Tanacetum coccineum]
MHDLYQFTCASLYKARTGSYSGSRAGDREDFDKKLNEKEIMYMRYRDEAESSKMMEEDKALKQLRTLVPYARPMPNLNKPFLPRKSSKGFTKPRLPRRSLKEHKEERWWWLQQHQVQPQI